MKVASVHSLKREKEEERIKIRTSIVKKLAFLTPPSFLNGFLKNLIVINPEEARIFIPVDHLSKLLYSMLIISIPVTISLFLFYRSLFLLVIPLIPVILLNSWLYERKSSISGEIKREMPFFSLIMAIFGKANSFEVGLTYILGSLRSFFKAISRELMLIKQNMTLLARDLRKAVIDAVENCPNTDFKEYMLNYVDSLVKGGSAKDFTEDRMNKYLEEIEEKWLLLQRNIQAQLDAIFIILGILPISLSMLFLIVNLGQIISILAAFLTIYILITSILLIHLDKEQLHMRDKISVGKTPLFSLSIFATTFILLRFYLASFLENSLVFITFVSISLSLLPISITILRQSREISLMEKELERFLKDLVEMMRVGYSVQSSIRRLSEEQYHPKFKKILQELLAGIKRGDPIFYVSNMEVKSMLVKNSLIAISAIIEIGGGLTEVERMREFVKRYRDSKQKMIRNSLLSSIVAMSVPLLGLFGIKIFEEIARSIMFSSILFNLSFSIQDLSMIVLLSQFLVLITVISTGLILGKTVSGTVKNTVYTNVCAFLCCITLEILKYFRI